LKEPYLEEPELMAYLYPSTKLPNNFIPWSFGDELGITPLSGDQSEFCYWQWYGGDYIRFSLDLKPIFNRDHSVYFLKTYRGENPIDFNNDCLTSAPECLNSDN
jgi:hypothetical protein